MSASDSRLVKQLRAVLEEDRREIRTLRREIDRLRFLLGLHSLQSKEADSLYHRPVQSLPKHPAPGSSN